MSVGGWVVVKWFDGSIARIHLNLGQNRPADAASGSENWLLVGTDSRAGAGNQFGDAPGERSDTTILSHLDKDGTTTNVSFPRDTLVTIPEYTNSKGEKVVAHKDKFNVAIAEGGPSLLVQTVEKLTGIKVDHYVSVDLEGFSKISSALNGVPVCITPAPASANEDGGLITNINDGYSGFHGKYGEQVVAGFQAVAFVRQRHGLPDSDLSRIRRQQQFLGSVFRQATKANLLVNPVAVARLLSAIKDALTLDQNTSLTDLEKLAQHLRGVGANKIVFETVPTRGITMDDTNLGTLDGNPNAPSLTPNGQSASVGNVLIPVQPGFDNLIAKLKDQPPKPVSSASPAPKVITVTVPPSQVTVTVQNGVGSQGLAGQVTAALKAEGFTTGAPARADRYGYTKSRIRYAPGQEAAARTVEAAIPGSELTEDSSVTGGIVLVVGQNYTMVKPVNVGGAGAPPSVQVTEAPAPTTHVSAPPVTAASADNRCTY